MKRTGLTGVGADGGESSDRGEQKHGLKGEESGIKETV